MVRYLLISIAQCVICVAVGKSLDKKEVETIASDPDNDNLFMLDNFRDLLRSVGKVKTAICKYTDLGLCDWYMSSRMNQNGATLAVDENEGTCMVTGYEKNPWAALTFKNDLSVHTVDLSGRFHGDIQVRIGAQIGKKGNMVPPVMSTTLCQTLPPQKNGVVEGTLHCWKTGVGNTIYLIGNSDTADKMEICSLEINP